MRLPVFAHNSNPSIDRFLVKKSAYYVAELIATHAAVWLDRSDPRKGCILLGRFLSHDRDDSLTRIAGSGFDSAWGIRQSGWAGPLTWQLKTANELR